MILDQVSEKDWYDRNWKWAVPVGCLGALVVVAVLVAALLALVFGVMKYSDVYKESIARARANPQVTRAMGVPVEEGFFVFGSIHVNGPLGEADMAIPISGPRASGTIYVEAKKSAGLWQFTVLEVAIEGFESRIDLLEDSAQMGAPISLTDYSKSPISFLSRFTALGRTCPIFS